MSVFRIPNFYKKDVYFVYAIFCQDAKNDPGYVKFGFSKCIESRIMALKTGMPIPIKYIAFVEAGTTKASARDVESSLHKQFKDRRTSGEWFRFDVSDDGDKADFNEGSRAAFMAAGKTGLWWEKISMKALEKACAYERKRRAAAKLKARKEAKAKYIANRNRHIAIAKAQKEARKKRN